MKAVHTETQKSEEEAGINYKIKMAAWQIMGKLICFAHPNTHTMALSGGRTKLKNGDARQLDPLLTLA